MGEVLIWIILGLLFIAASLAAGVLAASCEHHVKAKRLDPDHVYHARPIACGTDTEPL